MRSYIYIVYGTPGTRSISCSCLIDIAVAGLLLIFNLTYEYQLKGTILWCIFDIRVSNPQVPKPHTGTPACPLDRWDTRRNAPCNNLAKMYKSTYDVPPSGRTDWWGAKWWNCSSLIAVNMWHKKCRLCSLQCVYVFRNFQSTNNTLQIRSHVIDCSPIFHRRLWMKLPKFYNEIAPSISLNYPPFAI